MTFSVFGNSLAITFLDLFYGSPSKKREEPFRKRRKEVFRGLVLFRFRMTEVKTKERVIFNITEWSLVILPLTSNKIVSRKYIHGLFHDPSLHLCSGHGDVPGPPGTTLGNLSWAFPAFIQWSRVGHFDFPLWTTLDGIKSGHMWQGTCQTERNLSSWTYKIIDRKEKSQVVYITLLSFF